MSAVDILLVVVAFIALGGWFREYRKRKRVETEVSRLQLLAQRFEEAAASMYPKLQALGKQLIYMCDQLGPVPQILEGLSRRLQRIEGLAGHIEHMPEHLASANDELRAATARVSEALNLPADLQLVEPTSAGPIFNIIGQE